MLAIWKWRLDIGGVTVIPMPERALVLDVQVQGEDPQVWALVDPEQADLDRVEERKFTVIGTGHQIPYPKRNLHYLATFQLLEGRFVGHAFELVNLG